ncbi:MAG: hypothetical protein IPF68_03750 [Bacteroidales bacterium]|nr:hypothetical protein [Bacteroidales bacterium]
MGEPDLARLGFQAFNVVMERWFDRLTTRLSPQDERLKRMNAAKNIKVTYVPIVVKKNVFCSMLHASWVRGSMVRLRLPG